MPLTPPQPLSLKNSRANILPIIVQSPMLNSFSYNNPPKINEDIRDSASLKMLSMSNMQKLSLVFGQSSLMSARDSSKQGQINTGYSVSTGYNTNMLLPD